MTCLRNTLTREQIKEREEQRTAEWAARKLLDEPDPTMPSFTGKTTKDLANHRILEIDMKTDVGYPWSEGPWYAKHHTRDAVDRIRNNIGHWDFNVASGPINAAFKLPAAQVRGLRDRIDPALYVARAELDNGQTLSDEYDVIEAKALQRITATLTTYKTSRKTHTLKVTTAAKLKDAMQELRADLIDLQHRLARGLDQLPPRELPAWGTF